MGGWQGRRAKGLGGRVREKGWVERMLVERTLVMPACLLTAQHLLSCLPSLQVLRLTKGWDVARDHVRKAVETDVQLRVYHPGGLDGLRWVGGDVDGFGGSG